MKRPSLLMLCLFALASLSQADDSLNVRTVGSWPYYGCIAIATGHAGGHHVALLHCRGGVMTVNIDDPTAPKWMGATDIKDGCSDIVYRERDICVQDSSAYIAMGKSGLAIIDFADPSHPVTQCQISSPGAIRRATVKGNYLFAADDSFGLRIYDITDPSNPSQVNMIGSNFGCLDIARRDTFLFMVADQSASARWIISLNISNPADPVILDSLSVDKTWLPGIVIGQYLYSVYFQPIVDISDPHNMVIVSNNKILDGNGKMAIADTVLYTPNYYGYNGYLFYNVANPNAVKLIKNYPTNFYSRDVCLEGHTLYLADDDGGLRIVDVTDPANPAEIGHFSSPIIWGRGTVANGYAYIASEGLHIIDVSDPSRPRQQGYLSSAHDGFSSCAVRDTMVYATDWLTGLAIINIADKTNPIFTDSLRLEGSLYGTALKDTFVYVIASDTLEIIKAALSENPSVIGKCKVPVNASNVCIADTIAYVADCGSGLRIINVSNPAFPAELGYYDTPGIAYDVIVRDTFAYVADGNSGLRVINVANPASTFETGSWSLGIGSNGGAQAVALDGKLAYVAYDSFGMRVVNISDPAHPAEVGHYRYHINGIFYNNIAANGVSVWQSNAYVSYQLHGLQVFHYYGPTGVAGITNDKLQISNSLSPNKPNPFTANTAISYQLSQKSNVTLAVYNVMGQQVRTLASGLQQAGPHQITWNGRNDAGQQLSAGVYFCRLSSNGKVLTSKMVKIQ